MAGKLVKFIAAVLLCVPLLAQDSIHDALVKHWKVSSEFTMEVAKAMPADSYGFKPVPAELSFGQLMEQVAVANVGACAVASGMQRPTTPEKIAASLKDEKAPEPDKDTIVSFLSDSFEFCNKAVESMTPEKMNAVVGSPNRKMTGFEWLWAYFTHTAHHRGQAEVYLRLKGITPPRYEF
ncbi:MAG TPA: DinB family protein [Bryobacteraceae bacterium]|nr:DinB family protein [Bryobacteraceae bacterium]